MGECRSEQVALITGGGRGLGRGISMALAQEGLAVAVNYRSDADSAQRTVEDCLHAGAAWAQAFAGDVSQPEDRQRLVEDVVQATGRLDVLVNNAGRGSVTRGDMLDRDVLNEDNWHAVMSANLEGPFFLSQIAAQAMIKLKEQGVIRTPMIINVGSISANTISVQRADYCVSKTALTMVTQLFARRLAKLGGLVYEIRPGIMKTDMTAAVAEKYESIVTGPTVPQGRWGTPDDCGRAVASLVRGDFPFSTGSVIPVDGGFHLRHL